MMKADIDAVKQESARIEQVYRQREAAVEKDLYAPWQPAENLILAERKRVAAELLNRAGNFPAPGKACLEIGYGKLGWLADLISWGLRETDLHGIELDAPRAAVAQKALPGADLRVGDATRLPWTDETFDYVVVSTVFSSILNAEVRDLIAREIERVLRPGGALVWYDMAVDNPANPDVKGIKAADLKSLFPSFKLATRSVTLAPPVARRVAPRSRLLADLLSALPFLRTHLLGVLVKS